MSSTGRGGDRIDHDVYPTPAWTVARLLEGFPELPGGVWLEPCVGSGAIVRAVKSRRQDVVFVGADIRDVGKDAIESGCKVFHPDDYAKSLGALRRMRGEVRVVITNPPFTHALDIVKLSIKTGAWTVMLLRLNFLGSGTSNGKAKWLRDYPPDVGVLPNRPSFAASIKCSSDDCSWRVMQALELPRPKCCPACGSRVTTSTTDSIEYGWFVWPPNLDPGERRAGRLMVLNDTPDAERRTEVREA